MLCASTGTIFLREVGSREVGSREVEEVGKNATSLLHYCATSLPTGSREVGKTSTSLLHYCATSLKQATLADLYDEVTMPYDLRVAHRKNDLAVAELYGWEKFLDDEPKIAVELLKLYESLTES